MEDKKMIAAMKADGVRLSDIATRVEMSDKKLRVEFTIDDLVKRLGPQLGGIASSCGGCYGCSGCSM